MSSAELTLRGCALRARHCADGGLGVLGGWDGWGGVLVVCIK